jgi:site-specific DNA-methyltransferase (adenine-specific)
MDPYYNRDGATIYLGDCREVLPELKKGAADVMVTDPPYGVSYRSNYGGNFAAIKGDDDASWVPGALAIAADALRNKRHAYIFGPRDLIAPPFRAATELVWDKGALSMGDLSLPWAAQHEPITFAVLVRGSEKGRGNLPARLRAGSILSYPRPRATRHPTEKPVALLRRLIESSSLAGETVLDPFLGSGSTLVAAVAEGRRGVGVELEEKYAETAAERVDAAIDAVRECEAVLI